MVKKKKQSNDNPFVMAVVLIWFFVGFMMLNIGLGVFLAEMGIKTTYFIFFGLVQILFSGVAYLMVSGDS